MVTPAALEGVPVAVPVLVTSAVTLAFLVQVAAAPGASGPATVQTAPILSSVTLMFFR